MYHTNSVGILLRLTAALMLDYQSQSQGSITLKIIPAVGEDDKIKESRVRNPNQMLSSDTIIHQRPENKLWKRKHLAQYLARFSCGRP